jgi:transposase-like protein
MESKLFLSLIDEKRCFDVLRSIRWPEGVHCPQCRSTHYWTDYEEEPKLQYKCCQCGQWWTDFTDTIFEGTHLPLSYWFMAVQWFYEGKSALWVSKELCIGRHTVEQMYQRIRNDLWTKRISEKLSGITEADEVYISCGEKGTKQIERPARKRGLKKKGRGTWDSDKPPVVGLVERANAKVRLEVCENANKVTCNELIERHVEPGSTVNTDEWGGYNNLSKKGYDHKTVCHSAGEYARDEDGDGINEVHVNTMEGIWSLLRQYIRTFRGVCKKYLHLYVNAFEFLHNLKRRISDGFLGLLTTILTPHESGT